MPRTVLFDDSVERTQEVQRAMRLLLESDQEMIETLPELYREKAEEARERLGTR